MLSIEPAYARAFRENHDGGPAAEAPAALLDLYAFLFTATKIVLSSAPASGPPPTDDFAAK